MARKLFDPRWCTADGLWQLSDFRSLSASQMHKSSRRQGFKYPLMASDWLLITLSSVQVLCSNQEPNRRYSWTDLMPQCLHKTLTHLWCRQAPLEIPNYLMLIKSQTTFLDGLLAWVPKLVLLCTVKDRTLMATYRVWGSVLQLWQLHFHQQAEECNSQYIHLVSLPSRASLSSRSLKTPLPVTEKYCLAVPLKACNHQYLK